MTNEPNPNTPYESDRLNDPTRSHIDDRRLPADLDNDLQVDPELAEGPASGGKIALFAVGIAVVLGAVFYGLNHSSMNQQASTVPTPATAENSGPASPPTAPAGMRDVTPRNNSASGVTTGSAPAQNPPPAPAAPANGNAKQ